MKMAVSAATAFLLAHATSAFMRLDRPLQPQTAAPHYAAAVAEPELVEVADIDESLFVDEAAALARSTFPLSADEMIMLSKKFISSRGGLGADPALLAESFVFEGPVVGPLDKQAFVDAIGSVDFDKAFPARFVRQKLPSTLRRWRAGNAIDAHGPLKLLRSRRISRASSTVFTSIPST